MKKLLFILCYCLPFLVSAQITLQTVDFESDGSGYSVAPSESNANTNNPDYWIRTNGTIPVIYSSNTFSTSNGSYFFAAEDLDFDGGTTEHTVTCDAVSVSEYNTLQIKLLVGGRSGTSGIEGEEFLKIQYNMDGGGWVTRAQFIGDSRTNYYEDEDADGTIDGSPIDETMSEFTYSIPVTGSSLQVRIYIYNGGSEELAIDNIRVLGTAVVPVELISFSASIAKNSVKLNWETATEVNNYGFEVERRVIDGEWSKIGFVEGHGNSNSPKYYEFIDENVPDEELEYRLKQIDTDGKFEDYHITVKVDARSVTDVEENSLPTEFALEQNYPNPFNPTTNITYSIPQNGQVQIKVYDMLGNEITTLVNEQKQAGTYEVEFNASNLSSGIYLYKIRSGDYFYSRKMILAK